MSFWAGFEKRAEATKEDLARVLKKHEERETPAQEAAESEDEQRVEREAGLHEKKAFWAGFEKSAVSIGWIKNKISSGAARRGSAARQSGNELFLRRVRKSHSDIEALQSKLPAKVKHEVSTVMPDNTPYRSYSPEARAHLRDVVHNINKNYSKS